MRLIDDFKTNASDPLKVEAHPDQPGRYRIGGFGDAPTLNLRFQEGAVGDVGANGVTPQALLAVVADRLRGQAAALPEGTKPDKTQADALKHIEAAQKSLLDGANADAQRRAETAAQAPSEDAANPAQAPAGSGAPAARAAATAAAAPAPAAAKK